MEINAEAYLRYRHGESITTGWERLEIVVKFKSLKKSLLKKKIIKTLATTYHIDNGTDPYGNYEEYYDVVKSIVTDKEYLNKVVEGIVKDYVKEHENETFEKCKRKEIVDHIDNMKKFEVKVTIR